MREDSPSRTAAWVALGRAMGRDLPPEAQLAIDPYGAAFEGGLRPKLHRVLERAHIPVHRFPGVLSWILYMQVRTRVIDDAVRAFVDRGGRQLVLLGAGYDTRALRLPELAAARVFEIDHPATQRHKRAVLDRLGAASPSTYLTWDFERPLFSQEPGNAVGGQGLPAALAAAGCDPHAPTFTIWEGVTMYLTETAIDASLRAIRTWSPAGSQLALTYFAKKRLARPTLTTRGIQMIVARVGEPWRFGWAEGELAPYLAARGFQLARDVAMSEAARELLPPQFAAHVSDPDRRFALAASAESIAVAS